MNKIQIIIVISVSVVVSVLFINEIIERSKPKVKYYYKLEEDEDMKINKIPRDMMLWHHIPIEHEESIDSETIDYGLYVSDFSYSSKTSYCGLKIEIVNFDEAKELARGYKDIVDNYYEVIIRIDDREKVLTFDEFEEMIFK